MLLACVIIEVHSELSSFIHISSIHSWCDSATVLHWFNGDGKKQEVFDRRMTEEVHKLVDVDCWYHLESKLNPADILGASDSPNLVTMIYGLKEHQQFYWVMSHIIVLA